MPKRKEPLPRLARLYRVFPWLDTASSNEPGHPLFVSPPQGQGRIDNPERYLTLYASDDQIGAIGEAFGNHAVWTTDLLGGPPALRDSRRALVTLDASKTAFLDLDDPKALVDRDLRPSRVVTRDRATTQGWSLKIFSEGKWDGVRWWSYHNPDWGSFGVWNRNALRVVEVKALSEELELVGRAAAELNRVWVPS
jgi:RES domain